MLTPMNLIGKRRSSLWRIEETEHFVIHREASLADTKDLRELIGLVDGIHDNICAHLEVEASDAKRTETALKLNLWLYAPDVLIESGHISSPEFRMFYGTANAAGVHAVVHNLAWTSDMVIDRVAHEDIHAVWSSQVGEAPSILNEGIAAYFERRLSKVQPSRLAELETAWLDYAAHQPRGWLRSVSTTDGFWCADEVGVPAYEIGGQLVRYIVEQHGLNMLRQLFLSSSFGDGGLANKIEHAFGIPLDEIEGRVTIWSESSAKHSPQTPVG